MINARYTSKCFVEPDKQESSNPYSCTARRNLAKGVWDIYISDKNRTSSVIKNIVLSCRISFGKRCIRASVPGITANHKAGFVFATRIKCSLALRYVCMRGNVYMRRRGKYW